MAPLLKSVEKAGIEAVKKRRNPLAYSVDDFFRDTEMIREHFGRLVNASADRVVLVPSVSYGMANVARNIKSEKGQNIILAAEQFPSNYYPWKKFADDNELEIRVIGPESSGVDREETWNRRILDAIDDRTCFLALAHTHWADGTRFDLKAIREKSEEYNALLIVDGTQSVGALPFDIKEFRPDALICAGYKWLMGPYALGLAYYGDYFQDGTPIEENWINRLNSEDFKGLVNYENRYKPGALRFEVGEHSNFNLVPMLLAALEEVCSITPEFVQQYTGELIRPAIQALSEAGYRIAGEHSRANHLFGIRLPQHVDAGRLKDRLADKNIIVSWRGDSMRVAPNVYNTQQEMEQLTSVLLNEIEVSSAT
ncbi:MAG: aminotransferase class V-fold PLP-dependent enzyme [Cyclobacteriaceae bacterium]